MNGKPGDDPINDICTHGLAVFSPRADSLIREIHEYLPRYRMWELFDELFDLFKLPPMPEFERQLEVKRDQLKRDAIERGWEPPGSGP